MNNDDERDFLEERSNAAFIEAEQESEAAETLNLDGALHLEGWLDDGVKGYTLKLGNREVLGITQDSVGNLHVFHWPTGDEAVTLLHDRDTDFASSASRQHYIDTGRYLAKGVVED